MSQELLKLFNEYFQYNHITGILIWKKKPAPCIRVGNVAGCINYFGYIQVRIRGKIYKGHRIAFLMHHKYLPKYIDHIDGNKVNNSISNLRECTFNENMRNRGVSNNSTSGYKGVGKNGSKWRATIKYNRVEINLGRYENKHDAAKAYNLGARMYHGEFAYTNIISEN
jgi:hypothetical protein